MWGLSATEQTVMQHLTRGLSNREVAALVFRSEKTVKFHITNIYKKVGVKTRAQLIVKVQQIEKPWQKPQLCSNCGVVLPTGRN